MADKQQNILVNFKYNTAELERAQGIVNRANEANNRLQQSAQKAGEGSSQAYRGATQSIVAMQNQLTRLKSIIEVTTDPKKVAQLSAQYKQLKSQLDATNKAYFEQAKAVKEVQSQTKSLGQNFGQLYSAIRTFIAAGIVAEVIQTSVEMAKLAGNVEGVSRAFTRRFPEAELILSELQKATHGAVSEFELMQRTLQATNLGVSVEQLPILFEFAAARAQQTGESVDYLVDSIVRGIGRKSILVLDNLGLSATRLKEQFNGASLASQSVADVTKGVAEIARVELEKMGGYIETSATKVDQLNVALKETKIAASEAFNSSIIVDWLINAAKGAEILLKVRGDLTEIDDLAIEAAQKRIAIETVQRIKQREASDEAIKTTQQRFDFIQQEINTRVQLIGTYNDEIKKLRERKDALQSNSLVPPLRELVKLYNEENRAGEIGNFLTRDQIHLRIELNKRREQELGTISNSIKAWQVNKGTINETIDLLKQYISAIQQLPKEDAKELGIIEAKKAQIEAIQDQIEKTRNLSDLSSRIGVGKLITDLAVAQSELKELLEGPANTEFKVKFDVENLNDGLTTLKQTIETELGGEFTINIPVKLSTDKDKVLKDFENLTNILKGIPPIPVPVQPVPIVPKDFGDKLSDAIEQSQKELITGGVDIVADQLISVEDAEVASLQNRLNNLRNFYDEQILLAGDNDRAKKELRLREERETAVLQKKIAQREKEARRFSVIIDTAAGIARAFATAPNIAVAIVQAALVAAQGASQLAIINRTVPRFAKGVIDLKGPGTGTSDSINAKLSRGESVMTAKETQNSRGILKDIRAKKLDDKVLQNLKLTAGGVKYVGMDDSRLLKKLDEVKNAQPNLVEQSGQLFRHFNKGKDYKRKVRLKNMGY